MKNKTSLKDIAKAVGVSIPLVSYVLSDKGKENRVSEKTAKKIREVAKKLNYHPNLNAQSLKTNKTRTLGVILADISNPFFSHIARTIEDQAYSAGYTVIFGSSDEKTEKFERVLKFLITRQVDGFIIAAPEGAKDLLLTLNEAKIPVVLIDRFFKGLEMNSVTVDNYKASVLATNYLIKKGNRKIASVMYDSTLAHYQSRYEGYSDAMDKYPELTKVVVKVKHDSVENDMKIAVKQMIEVNKIDAVYFHTNTLAEEGLRQLFHLDTNILKKINLVVFDQNSAYYFLENFIPYINQPIREMGQEAVKTLISQIEEKSTQLTNITLEAILETKSVDI